MALVKSDFNDFLMNVGREDANKRSGKSLPKPSSEPKAKAVDGEAAVRDRAAMIKNDPRYAEWLDPDRSDADSLPEGMSELDRKAVRYLRGSK